MKITKCFDKNLDEKKVGIKMKDGKKDVLRLVVGGISIIFIIYMWSTKNVGEVYTNLPPEEFLPMVATNIAVSFGKILVIAGGLVLIKWIASKFK